MNDMPNIHGNPCEECGAPTVNAPRTEEGTVWTCTGCGREYPDDSEGSAS